MGIDGLTKAEGAVGQQAPAEPAERPEQESGVARGAKDFAYGGVGVLGCLLR